MDGRSHGACYAVQCATLGATQKALWAGVTHKIGGDFAVNVEHRSLYPARFALRCSRIFGDLLPLDPPFSTFFQILSCYNC